MQIGRYTRRQIDLYYREACRREAAARADRIEDVAAAFGGKGLNSIIRQLRGR